MNWRSLRTRLTIYSAGLIFISALIAVTGSTWHVWSEQIEHLDDSLRSTAKAAAHLLGKSAEEKEAKKLMTLLIATQSDVRSIRAWDRAGKLVVAVGNPLAEPAGPWGAASSFRNRRVNDHSMRFADFTEQGYQIEIGADLTNVDETIVDMLPAYAIILPLLLALTLVGGFWLAGRALRPIAALAREAASIGASELERKLPVSAADDEIAALTRVLNRMLDRLRVSFEQTRRFSSDASHELKTPLTILRGQLEAIIYAPHPPVELRAALASSIEEVDRLTRIIEGLLLFSRSDSGHLQIELKTTNFSAFLADLVEDAEVLAAPNQLEVQAAIEPELWILGNEMHLRRVVLNLLDNACKYNHPRGTVNIELLSKGDQAVLQISNTGPGIRAEQAARLFERFYRGDTAHGREVDGLGLGLAIAREIAKAHDAQLQSVPGESGWTIFTLTLPRRIPS